MAWLGSLFIFVSYRVHACHRVNSLRKCISYSMTMILGHAGAAHMMPSNTMEAFEQAIREEADGTELDVQMSSDGQLVCIHDAYLDNSTDGQGLVRDHTYAYLSRLNFSRQMPGYIQPTRIPLLADVLDLYQAHSDLVVNIEIKSAEVIYPSIERKIVDLVREHHMSDRVWYSSFNHFSLLELRAYDPQAIIAPLYNEGLVAPWIYAKTLNTDIVHPFYRNLTEGPGVWDGLQEHHIRAAAWTVDDDTDLQWMFDHHVNMVITDNPEHARQLQKQGSSR